MEDEVRMETWGECFMRMAFRPIVLVGFSTAAAHSPNPELYGFIGGGLFLIMCYAIYGRGGKYE